MTTFDEKGFMTSSGLQLEEYCDRLRKDRYAALDAEVASHLLSSVDELDEQHAVYVIAFGVHFRLPDISRIAVDFLNRDQPWHGPQYAVLQLLRDAHDVTVEDIDRIRPAKLQAWQNLPLPNIFPKTIEELRRTIASRDRQS